jgi:hypothetical protein
MNDVCKIKNTCEKYGVHIATLVIICVLQWTIFHTCYLISPQHQVAVVCEERGNKQARIINIYNRRSGEIHAPVAFTYRERTLVLVCVGEEEHYNAHPENKISVVQFVTNSLCQEILCFY